MEFLVNPWKCLRRHDRSVPGRKAGRISDARLDAAIMFQKRG